MNVLVHVGTSTFFNSLFELVISIRNNNIRCVFLFDNLYDGYLDHLNLLKEYNFDFVICGENKLKSENRIKFMIINRVANKIIYIINKTKISIFIKSVAEISRLYRKKIEVIEIVNMHKITHLLLASDLVQYDTGLFIKVIKKGHGSTIIFPQFYANYKESAEHIYHSDELNISKRVYEVYCKIGYLKKWVIAYKERCLIRLPLHKIIAKEIHGISPSNPWSINSGGVDAIMVEGKAVKALFMNEKIFDDDQIVVAGSINNDRLYHVMQNSVSLTQDMIKLYKLDETKPTALVAIPPDMHDSRSLSCDFNTYSDLVDYWMTELTDLNNFNILLSIHPSVPRSEYGSFTKYGYSIIEKPTVDYLPLADLFIASISATIQWSIACGIPVLNYDVYRYKYDDYNSVNGVLYAESKDEFRNLIHFYNDLHNLAKVSDLQQKQSHDWGMLDGKCSERIYQIITENKF